MKQTKVDRDLEAAETSHQDDPERAEVIARTRRFKSSWIELGEALSHVKRKESWRRFGYESLEQYTRNELKLKNDTVEKLLGSYLFLSRRAPSVLRRDGVATPIPSYQSVDFLRRAEESEDASAEAIEEIRQKVIDENASFAAVNREYGSVVFPIKEDERKHRDAAAIRNVAGRLRDLLGSTHVVPRKVASDVAATLEALLDALPKEKRAA